MGFIIKEDKEFRNLKNLKDLKTGDLFVWRSNYFFHGNKFKYESVKLVGEKHYIYLFNGSEFKIENMADDTVIEVSVKIGEVKEI